MEQRPADPPGTPGGAGLPSPARFQRGHRLSRSWQYQRTYREGRSRRGRYVVAYVHEAPGEPSRLGIVASRKVGGAVVRNRAKRRLREVGRALWPRIPQDGRQVVLIALPSTPTVDFESLMLDVTELMQQLGVLPR
jgi:ribonuclease P protein component